MSQIHDLYSYLKDKYGIPGTEKITHQKMKTLKVLYQL